MNKPPKGITPRTYWLENRVRDLNEAIKRRLGTEFPIPPEWMEERTELLKALQSLEARDRTQD
jgi:hypothetical protein